MFLEGITVCVNYSDFLEHTLVRNIQHFDNYIVVTTPEDIRTQELCDKLKVKYIFSYRINRDGQKFNKGRGINDGFAQLKRKEWIVHLDADMVLFDDFKTKLLKETLDKDTFYGMARIMCPSYKEWDHFCKTGEHQSEWMRQGSRRNIGVGYFQLFHSDASALKDGRPWYPEEFDTAGRSDRFFYRKFPARGRLRKMCCVHLDEGNPAMGVNWLGRQTGAFGSVAKD